MPANTPRRGLWTAACITACALGMGSKESMVAAPIVVALWDWVFAERTEAVARVPARWSLYLGLAATWVGLAALMMAYPRSHSVGFGFAEWPWWRYLMTQALVVVHYFRLALVPSPLVLDYGWPPASSFLRRGASGAAAHRADRGRRPGRCGGAGLKGLPAPGFS